MADSKPKLWSRFKPWLERVEHTDFITSWGTFFLTKAVPVIGGCVVAAVAWIYNAPPYIWLLSGLAALVLVLTVVLLVVRIREATVQKAPLHKQAQGNRKFRRSQQAKVIAPSTTQPSSSLGRALIVAAAASAVTGVTIVTVQSIIQNFNDQYKTVLDVKPKGTMQYPEANKPDVIFGIDVVATNTGPMKVEGDRFKPHFEIVAKPLTSEDEDVIAASLEAYFVKKTGNSNVIMPNVAVWNTMQDKDVDLKKWISVLEGKEIIYLFVTYKYEVGGKAKTSEFCTFINKDYPAIHMCLGHNRVLNE